MKGFFYFSVFRSTIENLGKEVVFEVSNGPDLRVLVIIVIKLRSW